jgi:hypothetical protein
MDLIPIVRILMADSTIPLLPAPLDQALFLFLGCGARHSIEVRDAVKLTHPDLHSFPSGIAIPKHLSSHTIFVGPDRVATQATVHPSQPAPAAPV